MEISCKRCHQTIQAENCYCPACGLPQLVYAAADGPAGQAAPLEHGDGAPRDAGSVAWKPALRWAMLLAIPAGVLSSAYSPVSGYGLFWMATAAGLAVMLYMRSQKPAWLTLGAGARIGLITGLLAGWLAFGASGCELFVQRYVLHQAAQIDGEWKTAADASYQSGLQMIQEWSSSMAAADVAKFQANQGRIHDMMLTPEGHAGFVTFYLIGASAFLLFFAIAGGALGARLLVRARRPEV